MKALYINFVDLDNVSSGSSVRPKKIYEAFNNLNIDVEMLSGLQNRFSERWKSAWRFFKKIKKEKYDFCYVESPSGPIFNLCDHLLLIYISKVKKIPIGFFYRDAYWKFAQWYNLGKVKKYIITLMHKFDWIIINWVCKKIYFPSDTMAELFNSKNKATLPPGTSILLTEVKNFKNFKNCIYVGGVSERYGTEILLEAFELINSQFNMNVNLTLICREEIDIIKRYKDKKWLNLKIGLSGQEILGEFYKKSDLAIIPFKRDVYMDFAIPIKMFEYMANNMPIVSTNCTEVEKFILENGIGIVTDDNYLSLAKGICRFYEISEAERDEIYKNIQNAMQKNTWEKRLEDVMKLANN